MFFFFLVYKFLFEYEGLIGRLYILEDKVGADISYKFITDVSYAIIDHLVEYRKNNPEPREKQFIFTFNKSELC